MTISRLDPATLRQTLGRFATGVTLVTCRTPDGRRVGLTVNSFNALSLNPPLVLWSLREQSHNLQAFDDAGHFAVNVLAQEQLGLSQHFCLPDVDRFGQGDWLTGEGGSPVLSDCAASLECQTVQRLHIGDHVLFIGEVLRAQQRELAPLLYHAGRYHALGEAR